MRNMSLRYLLLLSATVCLAKPLRHRKRYDLDGNGLSDICWTDASCTAHCLQANGQLTAFPATSCAVSTTSTAGATLSIAAVITTTAAAKDTSNTSSSKAVITTTAAAASSSATVLTGSLPAPSQFAADRGTKWSVDYVGNLQFTGQLQSQGLGGDKCRTGKIGDQIIWNCGDMECDSEWTICGFSMGPAFYGTDDVMVVNTTGVVHAQDNNFVEAWSGDPEPESPHWAWGMDSSNVAPINDTHGVAYAWEIWRGAPDGSSVQRGNAVAAITLGETKPIATRTGPLLTGPDSIALGLLAILRDGDYIYTYSSGGPSKVIIGRAPANDSVFDASQYEFLSHGSTTDWVSGIPDNSTTSIGATTSNPDGQFGCTVYGSVFFSEYLQQYVIVCNIDMSFVNMYVSPTPYGPWSAEYGLMSASTDSLVQGSYGSMVHPEYSNTNELYMSMGPNSVFNMFKITFNY